MKVSADIGKGAEHEQAFDESHGDHRSRPWRAEHGCVVGDKPARARGAGMAGMRNRIAQEFDEQGNGRDCKQRGEKKEHLPPAKEIAENAAGRLAKQLAENLARQEGAKHLLAALVWNDIAEESHR